MPAVTVENILTLPRVTDRARGRDPARAGGDHRAVGFEGEGFPVRRAFAGVDLAAPRPVHPHGPDG